MTRHAIAVLVLYLSINLPAAAAVLKGTATNRTTQKAVAGEEVILFSLAAETPKEIARSRTGARGGFQFTVADANSAHMVRVLYRGVGYQTMAPAGTDSIEVDVYDLASKLDNVTASWDMQRFQTAGDMLQVIEEVGVRNASRPPRTLERPFEIELPWEAEVLAGKVQIGAESPVVSTPIPGHRKGQYYFPFPIIPGEMRFAVAYRVPYRGEAAFEPKIAYPLEQLTIILPDTMKFEPASPGHFRPMTVTGGAKAYGTAVGKQDGAAIGFRIFGTGVLAESSRGQQQAQTAKAPPAVASAPPLKMLLSRDVPGGASASRLPNTYGYSWYFLGALMLLLASGAALVALKRKTGGPNVR